MRHQKLTELVSLVNGFLVSMTNQAYSRGMKYGYRVTWTKGTQEIECEGKRTKNYYVFKFYFVDKTKSIAGKDVELYVNFYLIKPLQSVEVLEELAYTEFLLNGIHSLANVTFAALMEQLNKKFVEPSQVELDKIVEDLKEQAKTPKLLIK
jgi:hypothetical protein